MWELILCSTVNLKEPEGRFGTHDEDQSNKMCHMKIRQEFWSHHYRNHGDVRLVGFYIIRLHRWWAEAGILEKCQKRTWDFSSSRSLKLGGIMILLLLLVELEILSSPPSWCCIPLFPIDAASGSCWSVFRSLGGLLKRRLPAASMKDSLSSMDDLIKTRTKIIVGAMP